MGEMVELTASDGHRLGGYVAGSTDAPASVVIVQEIFGVNAHIRSVVDRYAGLGYLAIAPALFDRAERNVELEYTPEGTATGRAIRQRLEWETIILDVEAALDHVRRGHPSAVVGYCFGGSVAWFAAIELDLDAAVGYYGGQIVDHLDRQPACPTLLHFGALDDMIPAADIEAIRAAHPDVPVHAYEGAGHGFNCDARASYSAEAAALAQERTSAFLAEHLG